LCLDPFVTEGATKGAGFAAIKLTALGRPELLISQGKVPASSTKEEMLRNMMRRLHTIFKVCIQPEIKKKNTIMDYLK
jgi:hypothetical protein